MGVTGGKGSFTNGVLGLFPTGWVDENAKQVIDNRRLIKGSFNSRGSGFRQIISVT